MDSTSPTISVVMAVFNGERFLQQAMESILDQTFANFELIVVDDGSTDHTPAILDSFTDQRIIRITNSKNIGQTRSLNLGLANARGRYIARHDADDISDPSRFAEQVSFMELQPAVGLLGTAYRIIDGSGRPLDTVYHPLENHELQRRLEQGNTFCHGSVLIRSGPLASVGGYNENFPVTQDYDLWLRLAERTEVANLANLLYMFRFDGASISRTRREQQLAYQGLARSLAFRRRAGEVEVAIPKDVLAAFPADRNRLYLEARGYVYLYYAAGQLDKAATTIQHAIQMQSLQGNYEEEWQAWSLSQAIHLADFRGNYADGEAFLKWLVQQLNKNRIGVKVKILLGEYYVNRAFMAYQKHASSQVRTCVLRAVSSDWRCLRNRGVWSIYLKSFR